MKQNEMAMGAAPAAGMDAGMGAAMPPAGAGMPQGGEGMEMEGETVEIPKAMFMAIYDVIKNLSSGLSEFATMLEGQAAAPEMQGGEMETEKEKGKSGDEEFLASIAEEGNYK